MRYVVTYCSCAVMLMTTCYSPAYAWLPPRQSYTTCVRLIDAPVVVFSNADHAKLARLLTLVPLERVVSIQIGAPGDDKVGTPSSSGERMQARLEVARRVIMAK